MFTNECYATQPSDAIPPLHQLQPDAPFTELVSVGLFEQQPEPELALFLCVVYLIRYPSKLMKIQDEHLLRQVVFRRPDVPTSSLYHVVAPTTTYAPSHVSPIYHTRTWCRYHTDT